MTIRPQLQKPSGGTFEQPLRPGMCIGICRDITEGEATSFGPTMYWWWEPRYTVNGPKDTQPGAFNADGTPWLIRDMTSTKFGKGKTVDKTAKARVRVEALLKREITDDEPIDGLLDQCIDKAAILYLTENDAGYLNVTLVQPYKVGTLAPMPALPDDSDDGASSDTTDEVPW